MIVAVIWKPWRMQRDQFHLEVVAPTPGKKIHSQNLDASSLRCYRFLGTPCGDKPASFLHSSHRCPKSTSVTQMSSSMKKLRRPCNSVSAWGAKPNAQKQHRATKGTEASFTGKVVTRVTSPLKPKRITKFTNFTICSLMSYRSCFAVGFPSTHSCQAMNQDLVVSALWVTSHACHLVACYLCVCVRNSPHFFQISKVRCFKLAPCTVSTSRPFDYTA